MKTEFSLANLTELDLGKVDVAFKTHLHRAVKDCMDRPNDQSPRKVTLSAILKPDRDQSGPINGEMVLLQCQVASTVPAHRSKVYQCLPRKGGQLVFESTSPENVNQTSFDDLDQQGSDDGHER
jgi:hypothetical protein